MTPTDQSTTLAAAADPAGASSAGRPPAAAPLFQVDAFTARRYAGNPAAVCLLERPAPGTWMQAVAAEMNLSETAFLLPEGDGHSLRWFTPTIEVELCGHATLASAHVLWETGRLSAGTPARFHTLSGELTCRQDDGWIVMDFPALAPEPRDAPSGLAEALGTSPLSVHGNGMDLLVELPDAAAVRALRPDLARLAAVETRGVMVTAPGDAAGIDFVSRFFAPRAGVPEDPVTGSAHCALGPFWGERLGKTELVAHQVSARGGEVRLTLHGDRVGLGGRAVTVLEGRLR